MTMQTSTPEVPLFRQLIPEDIIPAWRLGRHIFHDERSKDYPAEGAHQIVDVQHAAFGLPLNQGSVGKCTAEALSGAANSQPNFTGLLALPHLAGFSYPHTDSDTDALYVRETADEGSPWSPSDPGVNDIGGSGLAVCRAARELGWIARWANAFSLDAALRALVLRPVITGINWYDSFDSPDSNGLISISPQAQVRGGHEIVADQIVVSGQLVGLWQSWGQWGLNGSGRFFMSWTTWDRLLSEGGDVTVPGAAVAR